MNKKPLISFALGTLTLLAALPAGAQSGYFTAITNLNPVGYWPMHEVEASAPGDTEINYGSLGLLGTAFYPDWPGGNLTNAFYRQTNGALTASGDNDTATYFLGPAGNTGNPTNSLYVPHTSPLSTLNPPFSVECWTYAGNTTKNDYYVWSQCGYEGLNAGGSGAGVGKVCGIQLYWGPSALSVQYYNNSPAVNSYNQNDLFGQWVYVVVTVNATTNLSIFINGNQVGATKAIANLYSPDYWTPFTVGNGRGNGRGAYAAVDEVAVYTNVITDIAAHYAAASTPNASPTYFQLVTSDNPVIYLRMDAPPYTPPLTNTWPALTNFGSVAVNGVYTPGTMPGIVSGPFATNGVPFAGLAIAGGANVPQLGGVSSFGDAGYAAAYNPTGTNAFSVAAMFRGNPADNRYETIVGHSTNSWAINLDTNGSLQCQIGTNTPSQIISAGVYNDGNWHQAVEVYTPASVATVTGTNALYVDGVLDTMVTTVTTNGFSPGTNLDVMIGSDPQYTNSPLGVGRQFSGQVCEVALFNQALTAAQVQMLYNYSGVPPVITQQPMSASVNLNGAFTNTVVATGGVLGYQWYENNAPLSGQTNASLVLNPVLATNASTNYYVVLTNLYISVTSAVVSLTVDSAPAILAQSPTSIEVFAGSNPTLIMSAVGTGTLHYQWTSNGTAIAGATGSSYTIVNSQTAAPYGCTVSNAYGTNSLSPVTVTVLSDPTAPYPLAVLASQPIDYWRLDEASGTVGYDYTGGNNGTYTNVSLNNGGYTSGFNPQTDPTETSAYFGSSTTNNSYLGWVPPFVNFGTPTNTSAEFSVEAWIDPFGSLTGDSFVSIGYGNGGEQFCLNLDTTTNVLRFFVRNAGGTAYTAQSTLTPSEGYWHHVVGVCDEANSSLYLYADGQLVASNAVPAGSGLLASTNALTIGAAEEGLGTSFDDQLTGVMDDVSLYNYALSYSNVLTHYLAAGISPANLQAQPSSLNADVGTTVAFTAEVTATAPLSYFWYDNGNGGALISTNAVLTLNNVQATDSYQLQVTNLYGTATVSANLNVYSGPVTLVSDISPLTVNVLPATPVTFSAGIYGTPPISLQWFINTNTPIPGATNSTYSFLADLGTNTYTLWATNESGASTASSSTATVIAGPLGFGASGTGWTLTGGPSFIPGSPAALEITSGTGDVARDAFYDTPQNVEGFLAAFTYTPSAGMVGSLGEGATFTLQNSSSGAGIHGGLGIELGYSGIAPSVAFELDLDTVSPGGAGINWETNGLTAAINGLPDGGTGSVNIDSGDPINVTLYYDHSAGRLDVYMVDETNNDTFSTNYLVGDLGALLGSDFAYVGFTGGTAGNTAVQIFSNFSYAYTTTPLLAVGRGTGGNIVISWSETISSSFVLQQSAAPNGPWSNVATSPTPVDGQFQVTVVPTGSAQFYRLILPNP